MNIELNKNAYKKTYFLWPELSDEQKNEIVKQFSKDYKTFFLVKHCNQYSTAQFVKGKDDKWLIRNILDLYL